MRERPILFSGPMVRALLAGTKTQTRRVVKPQPEAPRCIYTCAGADTVSGVSSCGLAHRGDGVVKSAFAFWWRMTKLGAGACDHQDATYADWLCPYGQPGDQMWVREDHHITLRDARAVGVRYLADGLSVPEITIGEREHDLFVARKRPNATTRGRFMWRCLSRIELELTAVRVERLNAISEADALAEGIQRLEFDPAPGITGESPICVFGVPPDGYPKCDPSAVAAYRRLWEEINGAGSWALNPWVWVIEFRRVQP